MDMYVEAFKRESSLQFFGALIDADALIRSAVKKTLQLTKFQKLAMFKSCIDGLIQNLELYPQVVFLYKLHCSLEAP